MPSKNNKKRRVRKKKHHKQVRSVPSITESEIDSLTSNFYDNLNLNDSLEKFIVSSTSVEDEFFILGEGFFGLVTLGSLSKPDGNTVKVALKAAHQTSNNKMMISEADVMKNFDNAHVVKLLAVQQKPFKIVMEYMQHGDLLDALERNVFPNKTDLVDILIQVSSGMQYISEMNYVHRDLTCTNIFVDSRKQCKIGDFGLCKYVGNTGGFYEMPEHDFYNQYCAPEALDTKRFSVKCDVWSMGLLIWELYVAAAGDLSISQRQIFLDIFCYTRRIPMPSLCPNYLFFYMKNTLLNEDPAMRPVFSEIRQYLCRIFNR